MRGRWTCAGSCGAALLILCALEIGEHVAVAPALGAHFLPGIEIPGVAPDINHAVDRGRAAHDLAARRCQPSPAQMGFRLGFKAPVIGVHVHGVGEGRGHLDEGAAVTAAELEDKNGILAILRQAVGHDRSGGARAYDDKVEFVHVSQLIPRKMPSICTLYTASV
mgnify:CR=1 FL=1